MAGILFLLALICWGVALRAAMVIARAVPGASTLSVFWRLQRWEFAGLRQQAGATIEPQIALYKRAFIGFFAAILAFLAVVAFSVVLGGGNLPPAAPSSSSAQSS